MVGYQVGRTSRTTVTGRHLAIALPLAAEPAPAEAPPGGRTTSSRTSTRFDQLAPPRQDLATEEAMEVYEELLSIARATADRALRHRLDVAAPACSPGSGILKSEYGAGDYCTRIAATTSARLA